MTLLLACAAAVLQRVPWHKKFPEADPLALDLLDKMLQFDPRKRIDVQAALKHPWLAQLHDEATEPSAPGEWLQPLTSTSRKSSTDDPSTAEM